MQEQALQFQKDRYLVLRQLVIEPQLSQIYGYTCIAAQAGLMKATGDNQVPGTPCAYGDSIMDELLVSLRPSFESVVGFELFPTYSYFRVYKRGDILKKHTDRPACEISITLCLGYQAAKPWSIWIEGPGGVNCVSLEAGDALLYRGIECPHWRETFEGEAVSQVFLHYVDQQGPHAEWRFDKRATLGKPRQLNRDRQQATLKTETTS